METVDIEQAIVNLVGRPNYQPAKPRVIAKQLGLTKGDRAEVKAVVKKLVAEGRLAYGPGHLVVPAAASQPQGNRVAGVFRRTDHGYGFVRPTGAGAAESPPADVYIPARKTADASSGDQVVVQLSRRGGKKHPGPRGEIVEVVQRQSREFVGTYFESDGTGYVAVDGTVFARPVPVGDPGASGVELDEKVVINMVRFPTHFRDGEAVITEVLGRRGQPGVDTRIILREFGLPEKFPDEVLEDARQQAEDFDAEVSDDRFDATGETTITIDPVDARDFDDAISLVRLDGGHWQLGVHIADVSHFVRPNTALDEEARRRATSVYLPDRVIPMLPELISNGLASLQPKKVRYTKSVYIEFSGDGVPLSTEVRSAAIKSRRRLTYEQVDEFLADPKPWRQRLGARVHDLLLQMRELAATLRRRRIERGALELMMPEVKVELDKQGRVTGARVVEHTESHQIIEDLMLAANEAVARLLVEKGIPFLRRIHKAPGPRKLKALTEFVAELGLKAASLESRFALQKLLGEVVGRPEQHAVHYAVLRSLERAVYGPQEEGHHALASDCYCHFTSPIRRYPDLTIHRLLDAILTGRKASGDLGALFAVGEHCSDREQRAESAERELTKLKLLTYLSQKIGLEMDAVVTGVESYGLFVQGVELPAEGLIHLSALPEDDYRFDRTAHTLAGNRARNTFRLGDLLRVSVVRVDVDRRELDFRPLAHLGRPSS
ncbi:MAG: ribonuclease R, partial [Planctomycetota bacterium]